MKIVASFLAPDNPRYAEHSFRVYLIDRCKQELRGQKYEKIYEKDYTYTDTAVDLQYPDSEFVTPTLCHYPPRF